jgi:hypothetical protein
MHSLLPEPVHSLRNGHVLQAVFGVLVVLSVLGCSTESPRATMLGPNDAPFEASTAERSAALAVLDSLQHGTMETAFDRLARYAFTYRVHTAQLASDGAVVARRTEVLRFPPSDSTQRPLLVRADSSGSFEGGWFDVFAEGRDGDLPLTDRAQYVLPDDPAYLAPRTREAFRYRLLPDTSLHGQRVRVVEIHAQPGELGADRVIRHARLFVEPDTYELLGLYLVRTEASVLFREDSRTLARLRPAPDSGWVPATTRLEARLKMPLQAAQSLRMEASFFAYRLIP